VHPGPSSALPELTGDGRPLAAVRSSASYRHCRANAGGRGGSDISDYELSLPGASPGSNRAGGLVTDPLTTGWTPVTPRLLEDYKIWPT
jgi:hypothetical protein